MDNLLKVLMDKANLDEKTAEKVLDVVKEFVVDKLPDAASKPVLQALDGIETDDAMDMAKNVLGKFL
jgi:HEPN domain-containing protein